MDNEEVMTEEEDYTENGDLPEEDMVEESDDSDVEDLDSFVDNEEEQAAEEQVQEEPKGTTEPGYVQKRIDKALARERENIKAEVMAEMEAQYAPIRERLLEMDAQELLHKGVVKDIETARELARYRNGQQPQAAEPKQEQPRNSNGQYAPKQDPATMARIDMLKHQVDVIAAEGGPDVISEFQNNEDIKKRVISGELDFYDVAKLMRKPSKKKPPAPMRSPNGASGSEKSTIANMTDEQFERLEKKISGGARFNVR